jgi:hypothetical protein
LSALGDRDGPEACEDDDFFLSPADADGAQNATVAMQAVIIRNLFFMSAVCSFWCASKRILWVRLYSAEG